MTDRATLVPRIKTGQFSAVLAEMNIPEEQQPYTEPLVAELLVSYGFDLPGVLKMASRGAIAELGLRAEEVRSVAVSNLERRLKSGIRCANVGPIKRVVTGAHLEACTLLVTTFWDMIARQLAGELVVAVPSRDVVLFCNSSSPAAVATLRAGIVEVLQDESVHALSERLLVWHDGRWHEFDS